jgi:hypothetical protein
MTHDDLIDEIADALTDAQDMDTTMRDFARAVVRNVPAVADGLVWREIALAMSAHIGHEGYEAIRERGIWSKFQNLLSRETPTIRPVDARALPSPAAKEQPRD